MQELEAGLKMLSQYGAPLVITAGVLWFLFTRVPKWFDKSNETQERVAKAVEQQSETMIEHANGVRAVMEASNLFGEVGHKLASTAVKVGKRDKWPSDVVDELTIVREKLRPKGKPHDSDQ